MDNQPKVESEQGQQNFNIKEQFTTVTPFSKYLAMALFVALPFAGFYLGRMSTPSVVDAPTSQTNELTETVKTLPADNQIDKVVGQSTTTSLTENNLLFSREDIKVGNIIKIAGNQIPGSYETDSTPRDYTLTSVRQISIPDKKVEHSIFQACYLGEKLFIDINCEVFAINTTGQIVSVLFPRSQSLIKSENVEVSYQKSLAVKIKEDILNNDGVSDELFIRPKDYPYIYQVSSCGDATTASDCSLLGANIDVEPKSASSSLKLASKGYRLTSSAEFSGNLNEPTQFYYLARKNVNGEYVELSVGVWIENVESKEKIVTVALAKGTLIGEEADNLLKITVPTQEKTELEYDYRNQSNEAKITIGAKEYTFDFTNSTLREII